MSRNESISSSEFQASQRRSLMAAYAVGTMLAGVLALSLLPKPAHMPLELSTTINPNTAPLASLVRLPGIGPARAEAIILLRESDVSSEGVYPFGSASDLQQVPGIGPKTAGRVSDSLQFVEGH